MIYFTSYAQFRKSRDLEVSHIISYLRVWLSFPTTVFVKLLITILLINSFCLFSNFQN